MSRFVCPKPVAAIGLVCLSVGPSPAMAEIGQNARPGQSDEIAGTFAGSGVECAQFRRDTGETVSLSGRVPDLAPGTAATLTGRWQMLSTCMQGRTFRVEGVIDDRAD